MHFGSVCSGIEAASVAWHPIGWQAAWLAEIEPFPSAVLAHHYPDVPNLGDMTTISRRVLTGEVSAPDVFCGGTPCQAFSVAGLRQSLDDARGNLTLTFVEIADAIDHVRAGRGDDECIVFWENVPGVLSTKDNAFGCFLGGLAGEDGPLEPPGGKWANAGAVYGPKRAVAWRTLDAQYFGVAQRRRRVFVVASARKGFDPAQVLFEWHGLRRDTAPSRETRQVAPTIPSRSTAGGGLGTDFDCDGGVIQVCPTLRAGGNRTGGDRPPGTDVDTADSLIPVAYGGNNQSGPIDVATARNACASASGRTDFETETFLVVPVATAIRTANTSANGHGISDELAHTLDGAQGQCVAFDTTHTLRSEGFDASEDGTGRGTPLVPVAMINMQGSKGNAVAQADGPSFTLNAMHGHDMHAVAAPVGVTIHGTDPTVQKVASYDELAQCLRARTPGNIDNSSTTVVQQPVAYGIRTANTSSNGWGVQEECTHTLDCAQGVAVAQPVAFDTTQITSAANRSNPQPGDPCHPLAAGAHATAIAFPSNLSGTQCASTEELAPSMGAKNPTGVAYTTKLHNTASNNAGKVYEEYTTSLDRSSPPPALPTAMQVRRLTPTEAERLMGFPDGYTAIPWRGKPADQCPDGPRYKSLGNSWAVPNVRWIGQRIDAAARRLR